MFLDHWQFLFRLKAKQYKTANVADCLKKHLETHITKQINCRIICQETVRKLIERLERLGYYFNLTYIRDAAGISNPGGLAVMWWA